MSKKCFLIDGRFVASMSTGVDRYAFEVIKKLEKICTDMEVKMLVPADVKSMGGTPQIAGALQAIEKFHNIQVIYAPSEKAWMKLIFPAYCMKLNAVPVNLCNDLSPFASSGIVCLHDVCYADHPEFFPKEETEWFLGLYRRIAKKASVIMTVSEFSKKRICKKLSVPADKVVVAGNGWQHFQKITPSEYIFDKLKDVERGNYYFTLSSANKNKNVQWVVQAAQHNPKDQFVIAGKNLDQVIEFGKYPNLIYAGYVTDEEAKALMQYCKAFIFPSYYEGFGIPPMEALSTGAKIIIAKSASLPEVFGRAAHYISPDNSLIHLESLVSEPVEPAETVLDRFSWAKTAAVLHEVMHKCI